MIRITGDSDTIDLRNPEFGDVYRIINNSIIRRTRVGEAIYYHDSNWPKIQQLNFNITRLTETEKDDFQNLMEDDAGKEFTIARIEGATTIWTYDGYIITPLFDIISVRPPCSFDISFDFQVKVT